MVGALSRKEMHKGIHTQWPTKQYEYPCDYPNPKKAGNITAPINHQPNSHFLSKGIHHLDPVPCTCPSPKILKRIQSLFMKKIQEEKTTSKELRGNCRVHNNNFDVLLESNKPIYPFLIRQNELTY